MLLGDLALLHDVGALLLATARRAPRIQVIVGNDGGGTIFDGLEVPQPPDARSSTACCYTPQHVDLERARGRLRVGVPRGDAPRAELDQALTAPVTSASLIEVPLAALSRRSCARSSCRRRPAAT